MRVVGGGGGIEAALEQLDDEPRDRRVGHEAVDHVGLGERHARLQEVLAERAQQHDLPPLERGGDDESVEPVVLDRPGPDLGEGLADAHGRPARAGAVARVDGAGGLLDGELVNPDGAARAARPVAGGADLERVLGDDPEAHVLDDRDDVRERGGGAAHEQLEVDRAGVGDDVPVEAHDRCVPGHVPLDEVDVGGRRAGRVVLAVGRREGAGVAGGERDRAGLVVTLVQAAARGGPPT